MNNVDKIIQKVFFTPDECAFTKVDPEPACSPREVVDKMKEYAHSKGIKTRNTKHTIDTMKQLLNCKSESCILKRKDFVEFAGINNLRQILDEYFKPEGPSTKFGLLSNFNIDNVLEQLGKKFEHRKFLHIPFQMRDFERVGTRLATVDLAEEFKNGGYKTFGVVFNTDWSTGRGLHWFCAFGEHYGDRIVLEYFNSSGRPPLPEIQAWFQKTKHHLTKELNIPVDIHYSTGIRYQDDEHSCGVYCLCYIWLRLEGVPPSWFKAENFNDKMMHQARHTLFTYSG